MADYIRDVKIARDLYESGTISHSQYVTKVYKLRVHHCIRGGILC